MRIYEFVQNNAKIRETEPFVSMFEYEGQAYTINAYLLMYTLSNGSQYFARCKKEECNAVSGGTVFAYLKDIKILEQTSGASETTVRTRQANLDAKVNSQDNQTNLDWIKTLIQTKPDGTMTASEYAKLLDGASLSQLKMTSQN